MLEDKPTMGDVSRLRLSPNESRLTRLLRVTLFWDPTGPCSSTAGNAGLSLELRPFQITDLCEDVNEENGQPRFSSVASKLPSRPGLSSPQSDPTELLKDSEEIFRDEDMAVMKRSKVLMMKVGRMLLLLLQLAPYHVHLCAAEALDSWAVGGWKEGCVGRGGKRAVSWVRGCKASPCDVHACEGITHSYFYLYLVYMRRLAVRLADTEIRHQQHANIYITGGESCLLRNVHLQPPEHIHPGSFLGEEMVSSEEQKNRRQFSFNKRILLLLACTRTLTRAGKSIYLNRRNYPLKRRPVSIVDTFVRNCNSDASASASSFTRFALLFLLLRGSWFWFLRWRSCRARAAQMRWARRACSWCRKLTANQSHDGRMDGRTEDWRINEEVAVIESKEYLLHSSKKWTNYLQNWRKKMQHY